MSDEQQMTVIINGKPAVRKVVGFNLETSLWGPFGPRVALPETFEGEVVHWLLGSTVPHIIKTENHRE